MELQRQQSRTLLDADCERHRNLYRLDEPVLERKHPAGPRTASSRQYRFSVLAQSSTECRCWTTSDSLVQHPADRDKLLHDPHLPSARSKQSAQACCPTSVLSVTPSQTHSRDPQLPGTPLRRQLLCPLPEPASHLGLRPSDR